MDLKQILLWEVLGFVVWLVIVQHQAAAHLVADIGIFLSSAAHGVSNFFAST